MQSFKLMQLIKDNEMPIVEATISKIQGDPDLPNLGRLPGLRQWADHIVEGLDSWPTAKRNEALAALYKDLGRICFERSVMLHEVLRGVHLLKGKLVELTRSRGMAANSLEIYAQEELEHRISFFFDWLLYCVVQGYEQAQTARNNSTGTFAHERPRGRV